MFNSLKKRLKEKFRDKTNEESVDMARTESDKAEKTDKPVNLVEKAKEKENIHKLVNETEQERSKEPEVRVITQEQALLQQLEFMIRLQQQTYALMLEGFAQVGVRFENKEKE